MTYEEQIKQMKLEIESEMRGIIRKVVVETIRPVLEAYEHGGLDSALAYMDGQEGFASGGEVKAGVRLVGEHTSGFPDLRQHRNNPSIPR